MALESMYGLILCIGTKDSITPTLEMEREGFIIQTQNSKKESGMEVD